MRISMNRAVLLSLLVAALMTLGGCDQNKSPAGNPAAVQAAPDPNGPPTDDEIFVIYRAFWTRNVKGASHWSALPFQDYVQPYAANKYDNGVTQTNAFGKEYSVTGTLASRSTASGKSSVTSTYIGRTPANSGMRTYREHASGVQPLEMVSRGVAYATTTLETPLGESRW